MKLAADIMLIGVSLRQPGNDGKSVAVDFSVVWSPTAGGRKPLLAAGL